MLKWHRLFKNQFRLPEMNENLLLVEDEQALRTATRKFRLRAEGYVVDTAAGRRGRAAECNEPYPST